VADDGRDRCTWALGNALMIAYHDAEWGVPVHDDRKWYEKIVLDGAQAGLSWLTILKKREGYREAFCGFDPEQVARFGARDIERLMQNDRIVRNRAKIASCVSNARAFLELQTEHGSFDAYIWQQAGGATQHNRHRGMQQVPSSTPVSEALSKDLKRRGFGFVGPTIVYAFMQAAGLVNDHLVTCFRHAEILRYSAMRPSRRTPSQT
jgi:DNA-3-methyladenine glycosylase I